jgi:glutamate racemase
MLDPGNREPDVAAPIGVFDSGVGGLTVVHALRERLPAESVVYLGDTARVPYGPKSPETVRRYTGEAVDFLLARGVKLIVIACNTATARAAEDVADRVEVPVVGVIEPGASAAARSSRFGRIGVIGTQGTIESGSYERLIKQLRPDSIVRSAACPLFVSLAEEGWTEGEVARLTAERYLGPLLEQDIDTLVLGCTHYPLFKPLLARVAAGVELIDSAEATAAAVAERLEKLQLSAITGDFGDARYFVTDDARRFAAVAERFLGEPIGSLEWVNLGSST